MLFLVLFFWDSAVLHRRASYDFPLMHCMQPETSRCFYITQEYSMWKWPTYYPLKCGEFRELTTTNNQKQFTFQAPLDAKFYKCYTTNLRFTTFVSACGDSMALAAVVW